MKKTQKRLGNKGFSLVELIVVIAIMAVLVGVLAPTLIKNVEKSRKSKDDQNLDTVNGAIKTVLAEEGYYDLLISNEVYISGTGAITIKDDSTTVPTGLTNSLSSELTEVIGGSTAKMTSNNYKEKKITFTIDGTGKVSDNRDSAPDDKTP
jgi:type IV pilus assembly protein PilA